MNIPYSRLPERICAWYAENKRDLPWREENDPYKIWVSEIMLQQTRVEAVKPYYTRFLKELPDIEALAVCPEDRLLKLWEGLGYYSRVRHMQEAARILVDESDGPAALPFDPKELRRLPGIGSYTAGAIASIAYGVRVPAVDGNVLRILARLTGDRRDIRKASVKQETGRILEDALLNCETPGDFNQGMMDLGAGICLPNTRPVCEKCPLEDFCEAHRAGKETELPFRSALNRRKVEQRTILVIRDGERVVLTKRPDRGLLAGMYEFPNLPGRCTRKTVLEAVEEQSLTPLRIRSLDPARHLFSHVEWQMSGYEIRVADFPEKIRVEESDPAGPRKWFLAEIAQIEKEYPVPSAYKAYAGYLQMKLGPGRKQQDRQGA